jgi:hypothetical protein
VRVLGDEEMPGIVNERHAGFQGLVFAVLVANGPNTFSTERPRVVLLDGTEPTVTVKLCGRARDLIRDQAFRARDGHEIGGALYAEPNTSELPVELEVERACGPGPRSTRAPTSRVESSRHTGAHGRLCVRVRIAGGRAVSALLWSRNPRVSGGPETHRT